MSPKQYHDKWFKKYIRAIHRLDQCQAMVEELESCGHPQMMAARNLKSMYDFLVNIADERVEHYKQQMKQ